MYPRTDNTLSLLGGAALGAVAMYLLDPEAGERRRREIAERTGEAAPRAGEALGPVWERVNETARNVSAGVAGAAGTAGTFGHGIADKISETFAGARDTGSRTAHDMGEQVSHLGEAISGTFRSARKQARKAASAPAEWFGHEEPSHAGAYAATGVGTLLLGAGLMYLLDPQRGRERRARVMDQATGIINRTSRTCRQMGRDLRNRAKGYAHEARGMFETEDAVSAEQLLQRIRSEIGHVCSHAGAIQVMTDNHGRVTLHGKVLASEADKVLATIKGVAGVSEVINLLSVKDTEQQMQQADTTAGAVPQF
jgi:hypothetical protein